MKKCPNPKCTRKKQLLPLEAFHKDISKKDGRSSWCKKCENIRARQYRKDNPGHDREWRIQYYQDRKKGILRRSKQHRQKNVQKYEDYNHQYYLNHKQEAQEAKEYNQSPRGKFNTYKTSAKKFERSFKLTLEDHFMPGAPNTFWQKPCTYCREPIETIGLDRIDNSKGYTVSNIVSCCTLCNITRGDRFTHQEMKDYIGPTIARIRRAWSKKTLRKKHR